MADSFSEGLRREAPHWSLAGDKQLLDVLQGLHQKIIEKCQETNRNLEKMVSALDEASIHLQNVNNKFTALSNSQFIESRVFDDDTEDLAQPERPKTDEVPKQDEMASLKHSLQVLEDLHETVTILCDSDLESGTDDEEDIARVVLKPKDLYSDRPLPYIIGSHAWKTKWHAGLVADDSDSVSSASVKGPADLEEYSDSEPESHPRLADTRHSPSISSSELEERSHTASRRSPPAPAARPSPPPARSQAEVAAELARRLAGTQHNLPNREPSPEQPAPAARKLYKPHQPQPGNVFLDEPPPLDSDQSEESDEDIFAELNKKQPYSQGVKRDNSVADDLFGRTVYDEVPKVNPPAKQNQPLFEDESEPELFADKPRPQEPRKEDIGAKKPIGGRSLFGSNANAESIGAAILKRNYRQSSASGEEGDQEPHNKYIEPKNKPAEERITERTVIEKEREDRTQKEKERDIFEDLFAKSERINKEKNKNKVVEEKKEIKKPEKKPDLFSDNIFDDIDDIFTTNIKVVSKDEKKAQKSIFDDDDDLFSDVSKIENNLPKVDSKNVKDIFDDHADDDIFSDKVTEYKNETKDNVKEKSIKETKSIFDDSDDDLFLDVDNTKATKKVAMSVNSTKNETISNIVSSNESKNISEDDLFKNDGKNTHSVNIKEESPKPIINESQINIDTTIKQPSKIVNSPDLFDDDGLFLFQSTQNIPQLKDNNENKPKDNKLTENKLLIDASLESKSVDITIKQSKQEVVSKVEATGSVFSDEDTQDDLFSKPPKIEESTNFKDNKVDNLHSEPIGVFDDEEDDDNIFNKSDKTIDTTVSISKPTISDKSDMAQITVINTKITVNPTSEKESVVSQNTKGSDTTVIDTKISFIPEVTNKTITASDITVSETKVTSKPDIAQKPAVSKISSNVEERLTEKTDAANFLDNMKEVDANKNVTDSIFEDFTTKVQTTNVNPNEININPTQKTDVLSDIFNDLPPVFEKPKEPKRSKNVNALFDDDSDDESLFFKKNDVITDERPEGFVPADDRLFGLFRDEPPAIDVDFIQKSSKTDKLPKSENVRENIENDGLFNQDKNDQSIKNIQKSKDDDKLNMTDDKDIFGNINIKPNSILKSDDIVAPSNDRDRVSIKTVNYNDDSDENSNKEDIFSNATEDIFKKPSVQNEFDIINTAQTDTKKINLEEENLETKKVAQEVDNATEPKKIGKLKPMNFNINVNTLLPGASPKKTVKSSDITDGQVPSRSNDELHTSASNIISDESESKIVKSISFDGNPDSSVLDNKLSKERAKIQVKRRPSTRRARREAVKKSRIDFGEDSTDNSSSIDDPPKKKDLSQNEEITDKDKTSELQQENNIFLNNEENITTDKNAQCEEKESIETASKEENNDTLDNNKKSTSIFDGYYDEVQSESKIKTTPTLDQSTSQIGNKPNQEKDVKSKVVYILNDEDIFNDQSNKASEVTESSLKPTDITKKEDIFDDPNDIFKGMAKNKNTNDGITTLGQVYHDSTPKTLKLGFLSDSDDDNLFKNSKPSKTVAPVVKKETEEQTIVEVKDVPLKSKNRTTLFDDSNDDLFKVKNPVNDNKKEKKVSLFGSDSDEELFSGSKKVKEVPVKKEEPKKEEVKRDTSSSKGPLFEDDDDLFGVSKKKDTESKPQLYHNKPTTTRELATTTAEPVFNDPLSLLGYDEE